MTEEEIAVEIAWRNQELKDTDWVIMLDDHPERPLYYDYRARLRGWPSTSDFPLTKPTL
jgi:hypothetical protein|tara:strand:- start:943 stop:1119 length:177 start_codon:yes stop_codon:yes gene_type:complete